MDLEVSHQEGPPAVAAISDAQPEIRRRGVLKRRSKPVFQFACSMYEPPSCVTASMVQLAPTKISHDTVFATYSGTRNRRAAYAKLPVYTLWLPVARPTHFEASPKVTSIATYPNVMPLIRVAQGSYKSPNFNPSWPNLENY